MPKSRINSQILEESLLTTLPIEEVDNIGSLFALRSGSVVKHS
jgi:hypothetical protein